MKNREPLCGAAAGVAATQQRLGATQQVLGDIQQVPKGGKLSERGRGLRLRAHTRGGKSHGLN